MPPLLINELTCLERSVANLQQTVNLQVLPAAPNAAPPSARERAAILAKAKGQPIAEVDQYMIDGVI